MALREYLNIKFTPRGGMNSDADPLSRKGGDYTAGAKNIQFLTHGGGTTFNVQPTMGNIYGYTLPIVSIQDKVYRVYIQAINSTDVYSLRLRRANSSLITSMAWPSVANDVVATGTAAIGATTAVLGAVSQTFTISALTVTSATEGYFDLSITTIPGWNYIFDISSVGNPDPTQPVVIQEAIDSSLAGSLQTIGSYDLNGDVFVWSTTQDQLPSDLAITNVAASPVAPLIRITVLSHGLVTGESVVIKNATTEANGTWIVNVIDANNFDLLGSVFTTAGTSGTVTINPTGLGEIGVAQKDDNSQTWTYTTLLRSREFNFVTKHQPKTHCERNDILASLYWTDNYNPPRVLYYAGPYVTNGALSLVNTLGEYEYGSIFEEIALIKTTAFVKINFFSQLQSGGAVPSGNHRYAVRLLTDNLTPTLWSDLSNVINVFLAGLPTPADAIFGDNPGTISGKINQLQITGIIPNLFKYIELADIFYEGGAIVGTIVTRELLTQQTTQVIQHTGLESNSQVLDITTLLAEDVSIRTALNIDAVSNRLILSNTSTASDIDFSAWTSTFTHSLLRSDMDGIRSRFTGTLRSGEYQLAENTFNIASYMLDETYRFSGKIKLKGSGTTENFWIDDVTFNTNPINTGNPFGNNRRNIGGELPSYDLTDRLAEVVYSFGINFTNIDWNFLVGGVPVSDLVESIEIERVEMTDSTREIKGSGIFVAGMEFPTAGGTIGFFDRFGGLVTLPSGRLVRIIADVAASDFGSGIIAPLRQDVTDYLYAAGEDFAYAGYPVNIQYDDPIIAGQIQPRYGSFYAPDFLFGEFGYQFQAGDEIIGSGSPSVLFTTIIGSPLSDNALSNNMREFSGYTGTSTLGVNAVDQSIDIQAGRVEEFTNTNRFYSKRPWIGISVTDLPDGSGYNTNYTLLTSPVFLLTANIADTSVEVPFGVHVARIRRVLSNKFGDIRLSKYIPTGFSATASQASVAVYGGDVFTQKTWMKHLRTFTYDLVSASPAGLDLTPNPGFNQGIAFYSQNRVNSEMINRTDSTISWKYPLVDEQAWLNVGNTSGGFETNPLPVYNESYTIRNGINSDNAYDPNLKRSNKQPARIWWSDMKPQNSVVDNYTSFLPLNFKDLQLSFGEITEHKNVNTQLMTWQGLHYELQYFDSTGLLVTNAQEAVLGNAGVMTQRGSALSTYGMDTPYACIKGKTQGGKDAVAWINTKFGKVMKHDPSQGTTVISDIRFMRSFFNNNLTFAGLYTTPSDGKGIHGVWDDVNSEFIWTVRANKDLPTWVFGSYGIGAEFIYGQSTFHEIPDIYVSLIINNTTTPDPASLSWRLVDKDDPLYYNWYTVAYNEVKNKFTTFYSYMPKIYLKRGKSFLSPRPVADERNTYEHLRGELCVWYNDGTTELAERWEISGMSCNEQPNVDKSLKAMEWQTQVVPDRIEIETKNYSTFMVAADCEQRQDQWVVPVKNDSRGTGINDGDTSSIFGSYAEVSISGPPRVAQLLDNFILKVRAVSRLFNT